MNKLTRYWFEFKKISIPTPLNLGCGVTAYDLNDAINILNETVFATNKFTEILHCEEDIDISTLDKKHVLNNMGKVTNRGVWFPLGYDTN